MSEVYCRTCEQDDDDENFIRIPKDKLDSPAILTNVSRRSQSNRKNKINQLKYHSILNVDSELEMPNTRLNDDLQQQTPAATLKQCVTNLYDSSSTCARKHSFDEKHTISEDYELGDDVTATTNDEIEYIKQKTEIEKSFDAKQMIRVRGKEELPVSSEDRNTEHEEKQLQSNNKIKHSVNEYDLNDEQLKDSHNKQSSQRKDKINAIQNLQKVVCTEDHPLVTRASNESIVDMETKPLDCQKAKKENIDDLNGNCSMANVEKVSVFKRMHRMYSTLPRINKSKLLSPVYRHPIKIPKRITADGTTIYYLCDLSKEKIKGV